ncbi:MAG: hypothetical protein M1836_000700 [Candelina mexicana]|nr:MAG: hypothetical protein M1836_000700 [Candelina mexicana]
MRDDFAHQPSIAQRRANANHTMDPRSAKSILTANGPASPVLPPPAERIGPLSLERTSPLRSPVRPNCLATQTTSQASPSRDKRLSLSFPVQRGSNSHYARYTPPSSASTTPNMPTTVEKPVSSPTEAGGFLTALAAQERRVLELKEELHRAEGDLEKLKKQWAMHEATRKKGEVKHIQQLQPLSTSPSKLDGGPNESDEFLRRSRDLERRKTMLSESRPSMKKVFSGRHTKTLSLLADPPANRQPFPQPANLPRRSTDKSQDTSIPRSSTLPDLTPEDFTIPEEVLPNTVRHSLQGPAHKEALLQTGRQMASDFREGLWTFLDDIRQATVGEEGVIGAEAKTGLSIRTLNGVQRQGSVANIKGGGRRSPSRGITKITTPRSNSPIKGSNKESTPAGADESFWKEHGFGTEEDLTTPKQKKFTTTKIKPADIANDDDDSWEKWDSPEGKAATARWNTESTSASEGVASPSTDITPHQLKPLSPLYKGDEIPWPSLTKLSPGQLKRTASSFITEWEKNLTPPTVSRSQSPDKGRKDD